VILFLTVLHSLCSPLRGMFFFTKVRSLLRVLGSGSGGELKSIKRCRWGGMALSNQIRSFYSGVLRKMSVTCEDRKVQYFLGDGDRAVAVNDLVGRSIEIQATNRIFCILCGRSIKKTFGEGSCYPCFQSAPENSQCIVRPELCEGHLGRGRDVDWEQRNHVQPHTVYLSFTSDFKVGVTRDTQIPRRWIDQGAVMATPLARAPYRQLAGLIEVSLKSVLKDKTNWRAMLREVAPPSDTDLMDKWHLAKKSVAQEYGEYLLKEPEIWTFSFPVVEYFSKVSSVQLDKQPRIGGRLTGMKGQYLIFEGGRVFNVRKHSGFEIEILAD
jgi:hypothetical protein